MFPSFFVGFFFLFKGTLQAPSFNFVTTKLTERYQFMYLSSIYIYITFMNSAHTFELYLWDSFSHMPIIPNFSLFYISQKWYENKPILAGSLC